MTIFKDSHHFSRTLGDVWWQSLRTAIMMTIFKDSHHFSRILGDVWWQSLMTVFNDSAFFERTLRGRFREWSTFCLWPLTPQIKMFPKKGRFQIVFQPIILRVFAVSCPGIVQLFFLLKISALQTSDERELWQEHFPTWIFWTLSSCG